MTTSSDDPSLAAISVTLGGPTTFVIAPGNSPARVRVVSSSLLIQHTLLPALLSGARPVRLDLMPASNVIKRVNPFALGELPGPAFFGDYRVSRIATQRKPNGTDEHLEVFLIKTGETEEKAYNVYDPFLQLILMAALFSPRGTVPPPGLLVDVQFDGEEIVTATVGEELRNQ